MGAFTELERSVKEHDFTALAAMALSYPNEGMALAEAAAITAQNHLPMGTVHVISDVHGEFAKLRHVVNNAAGALRPLVENLVEGRLAPDRQNELLAVIYYPREMLVRIREKYSAPAQRRQWVLTTLRRQFEIVRKLAAQYRWQAVWRLVPSNFMELFKELWSEPISARPAGYIESLIDSLAEQDHDWAAVRAASRLIRNLTAEELLVAGDLGDRGPRIDKVIEFLQEQPSVNLVWGNHDASWMGACLGNDACIWTVLRFSTRYRRLFQLEEGYGITLAPLDKLARDIYGTDPATRFAVKMEHIRDDLQLARMQKAAAILELKSVGQLIDRHPEWGLQARNLLRHVDWKNMTLTLDGHKHELADKLWPTIDPEHPNTFTPEERACVDRIRQSFVESARLWQQMDWVVQRGRMWATRHDALIFHACVPVDESGEPLEVVIDGKPYAGRELMDKFVQVVRRAYRNAEVRETPAGYADSDWFWYLWAGPRSPLFGKDKIATFEGYFIADPHAKEEAKNPYFALIHNADFVRRIGRQFDCGQNVLIVNGHVPVKVEKGEQPLKRGGNAVTIDGAFSEAYGDRGYSLLLSATRTELAEHAHFESVEKVLDGTTDMIPKVTILRTYDPPRRVADTQKGHLLRLQVEWLKRLAEAHASGGLGK